MQALFLFIVAPALRRISWRRASGLPMSWIFTANRRFAATIKRIAQQSQSHRIYVLKSSIGLDQADTPGYGPARLMTKRKDSLGFGAGKGESRGR
jgi:hypothetical protein